MKKKIVCAALILVIIASLFVPMTSVFAEEADDDSAIHVPYFIAGATPTTTFESASQKVRVYYLERVPDTPFAIKKKVELVLSVYNGVEAPGTSIERPLGPYIDVVEFKEKMDLSSFGVLQSYFKEFRYDGIEDGMPAFTAIYLKTYYLCAKTADANFKNYYVDCNCTFSEFFLYDVQSNIISVDDIEIFKNHIYASYAPHLDSYDLDELYGYWTLVVIPRTYTFNEFFADIGGGTFKSPNVSYLTFLHMVSQEEINSIDTQYGVSAFYRFLKFFYHLFSQDAGYTVYCYLMFCDGGDAELLITRNGSNSLESGQGAMVNTVKTWIENIDFSSSGFVLVSFAAVLALAVFSLTIIRRHVSKKQLKRVKNAKK